MNRRNRRIGVLLVILVIGLLALAGCGSEAADVPQSRNEVPRITPEEVQDRIDKGDAILIVDSRSAASYADRHIAGAISVPAGEVSSRLYELPKDQEIVLYCT